jgi:hypothetical protein
VSPSAAEVVRLAQAGTSEEVIVSYVQNSPAAFELTADQILYLRDIGVTSPVITAMLSRDTTLRSQPMPSGSVSAPPSVQMPPPEAAAVSAPLVPEAPPTYVSSPPPDVSYFYDGLSPYGTWVQLDGVGWCWQPRTVVLNHGWRPYCDSGHWVYTEAGWFWQSDYSWGWAPFHYGRWHLHERCGWVWLPDRVWGPAWVTWRSEGDHCGWAPLPPHAEFDVHLGFRFNGVRVASTFDFGLRPEHFTFIAVHDFNNHDYAHHRLAPAEVTRIYTHTTVINNYAVHNNTVINNGIKVDRVAAATHTEIRKVAIRDAPAGSTATAVTRGGSRAEVAVYRPELKAPVHPVNIVAQKVDQRHPVIQHAPAVVPASRRPTLATTSGTAYQGNYNRGNQSGVSNPNRIAPDRSAPVTGSRPPATTPYSQPKPSQKPSTSTATAARPATETPSRPPASTSQKPANHQYYPLRSNQSGSGAGNPPSGPSSSTYYPKGSPSGSDTHSSTPNVRPSESRGQNANNPRSDNSNNNRGNRKNEP